jgi:acyl carrier protein
MERTIVRQMLQGILEDETDSQLGSLRDEMVLAEQFELDSVDYVSLIMRVEETFHIRMSNAELSGVTTIGSLVNIVAAKASELPGSRTARRVA